MNLKLLIICFMSTIFFINVKCMGNWQKFQEKHILDESTYPGWSDWNDEKWHGWTQDPIRIQFYPQKYNPRRPFNTIIISTPDKIEMAFKEGNKEKQCPMKEKGGGESPNKFYWSSEKFFTITLTWTSGGIYIPYVSPNMMYIAVGFDGETKKPGHYHCQAPTQVTTGNINANIFKYPSVQDTIQKYGHICPFILAIAFDLDNTGTYTEHKFEKLRECLISTIEMETITWETFQSEAKGRKGKVFVHDCANWISKKFPQFWG